MDTSRFSTWKYQHAGPGSRSRPREISGWLLLGAALLCLWHPWRIPALILTVLGLLLLLMRDKQILLGSRYLICGTEIVYFANVDQVVRDNTSGTLRLALPQGRTWVLERDKFPTNARKTEKIARNRRAKFDKVADRLIERIRQANPGVHVDIRD